ncbi:hypothetical protein T09_4384, partial [Trichinella sp. T9]
LVGWAGWKLIFPFAVELCRFGFSVSTSLWSSVGASAMENAEVMVDDGGADLFNICTLLIGSFCNISSDSVRGVENRAERTWSSRRGPSALRCTDIWSFAWLRLQVVAKAPMATYHTTSSHPNSLLILAYTPVGPCSPNRSVHLKIHKASSLSH